MTKQKQRKKITGSSNVKTPANSQGSNSRIEYKTGHRIEFDHSDGNIRAVTIFNEDGTKLISVLGEDLIYVQELKTFLLCLQPILKKNYQALPQGSGVPQLAAASVPTVQAQEAQVPNLAVAVPKEKTYLEFGDSAIAQLWCKAYDELRESYENIN